jgi:hypothetical protein
MLTLREALRQPLTKPAVRKLLVVPRLDVGTELAEPIHRWFVLRPDPSPGINAVAIPCSSFDVALAVLRRLN